MAWSIILVNLFRSIYTNYLVPWHCVWSKPSSDGNLEIVIIAPFLACFDIVNAIKFLTKTAQFCLFFSQYRSVVSVSATRPSGCGFESYPIPKVVSIYSDHIVPLDQDSKWWMCYVCTKDIVYMEVNKPLCMGQLQLLWYPACIRMQRKLCETLLHV